MVTARLVGGLGNQLFCYYAGAALAGHLQEPLRIDWRMATGNFTGHDSDLRQFELRGEWWPREGSFLGNHSVGRFVTRAEAHLLARNSWLRLRRRVYQSPVVGHDPQLMNCQPGSTLWGYFQSWQVVEAAINFGYPRRPLLRNLSERLRTLLVHAEREKPIAVHIRRGDYRQAKTFGLLQKDYYQQAIALCRSQGLSGPIWVFSDEIAEALEVVDGQPVVGLSTSAEEMVLMSHCAANVIANSTFSWWGAWMNNPGTPVFAPDPWFQGGPSVEGLIPPTWTRIPAYQP